MKAPEKARTLIEARKIGNRNRAIHIMIMSVILYISILLPFQYALCKSLLAFDHYLFIKDRLVCVIGDTALASGYVDLNKI
jgi:hypothetical protein